MNTTDYFTNINAMFLFCIFTCGLFVWAVIRGFNIKRDANEDLKKAHDRIKQYDMDIANETRKYDDVFKQHIERGKRIIALEVAKDKAEKESRDLRKQLTESEKQANGYKAEFIAVSNELEATKSKVRKRDANGKFLPSGNARPKRVKKLKAVFDEVSDYAKETSTALDNLRKLFSTTTLPKLVHGMTVKNPTEAEAKMIFDEAKRLGVLSKYSKGVCKTFKDICYSNRFEDGSDGVIECVFNSTACAQVTAKEFVQRMQNGRG